MEEYLLKIKDEYSVTIKFVMCINESTEKYFNEIINVLDRHYIEHDINNNYNREKVKKSTVSFRMCLRPFDELNEIKNVLIKYQFLLSLFSIDDQHTTVIMGFSSLYFHILETQNSVKLCIKNFVSTALGNNTRGYEIITIEKRENKLISYTDYYRDGCNEHISKTADEEITLKDIFITLMIFNNWSLHNLE